jgi:hypothetical protein
MSARNRNFDFRCCSGRSSVKLVRGHDAGGRHSAQTHAATRAMPTSLRSEAIRGVEAYLQGSLDDQCLLPEECCVAMGGKCRQPVDCCSVMPP